MNRDGGNGLAKFFIRCSSIFAVLQQPKQRQALTSFAASRRERAAAKTMFAIAAFAEFAADYAVACSGSSEAAIFSGNWKLTTGNVS